MSKVQRWKRPKLGTISISKVSYYLASKCFNIFEVSFTPKANYKMICSCINKSLQHLDHIIRLTNTNCGSSNGIRYLHGRLLHLLHEFWLIHSILSEVPPEVELGILKDIVDLKKLWFVQTHFHSIFHLIPRFLSIICEVYVYIISKL